MKYLEKHPMIMVIVGVVGVSLSAILVRFSDAPSSVTAAWRLLCTVALLSPVVFGKKEVRTELLHLPKKELLLSVLSGVFLAVHFALWFESLQHTSVASSTTIVCTDVIWVSLGFCLFLKGKLTWKAVLAIAATFGGSVLIALADTTAGIGLYGILLALFAAIAASVYTLIGRIVRETVSTTVYTYTVYVSCAVMLLLFCAFQKQNPIDYGAKTVLVGLALAVASTLLGHSVFSWCLKYLSPSFITAAKLCEPVGAAILAVFLFREYPTWLTVAGSVIILVSVYFYSRLERKEEQKEH